MSEVSGSPDYVGQSPPLSESEIRFDKYTAHIFTFALQSKLFGYYRERAGYFTYNISVGIYLPRILSTGAANARSRTLLYAHCSVQF